MVGRRLAHDTYAAEQQALADFLFFLGGGLAAFTNPKITLQKLFCLFTDSKNTVNYPDPDL